MKHGSLFSGIGGFDLAAEWMGWENMFHCEWNPFGQKVLNYYWPNAKSYGDITKTDFTEWRGKVDIVSGGFPCQPYSQAGKRKGKEDDRHLWPSMLRAIKEIQPGWIVGENVSGLLNWSGGLVLDEIKADFGAAGFEVFPPLVLPACAVNAPHRRDRVWIVAHSTSIRNKRCGDEYGKSTEVATEGKTKPNIGTWLNANTYGIRQTNEYKSNSVEGYGKRFCNECHVPDSNGNGSHDDKNGEEGFKLGARREALSNINGNGSEGLFANSKCFGQQGQRRPSEFIGTKENGNRKASWSYDDGRWPTVSPLCAGNDGLSTKLDGIAFSKWATESIKGAGNAIVPQVAYEIFKAIEAMEK